MANITQTCARCQKQFLVIDQEQNFLKLKGLPLPPHCPSCRQMRRLFLRGGTRALFRATCQKCGKPIIVPYDPKTVTNAILCKTDYDQYMAEHELIIKDPLPQV